MNSLEILSRIRADARTADELHERSRKLLVASVRAGASAGLSQREISEAVGRSQPEISRLLRFHGRTTLGRTVQRNRAALLKLLRGAGASNVRVFGSVSRGEDRDDSDVDLLVDFTHPPSLFALARLEAAASTILGVSVDIIASGTVRENIAPVVLSEAVPL